MPHTVNRNAFLAARGCGHPLLAAYGLLVATELALKDKDRVWNMRHNVPQMLVGYNDPGLTALGTALSVALNAIPCTNLDESQGTIPASNYPYLRYACHASDYTGGTTDTHLQSLVQTVEDIILQLRANGVEV